ncbi:MAG TPA: hypothetical protein VFS43_01330 [Polyangiaceae bacterium]|nr:hypothetical protein [Polyangiaceae bacterium]
MRGACLRGALGGADDAPALDPRENAVDPRESARAGRANAAGRRGRRPQCAGAGAATIAAATTARARSLDGRGAAAGQAEVAARAGQLAGEAAGLDAAPAAEKAARRRDTFERWVLQGGRMRHLDSRVEDENYLTGRKQRRTLPGR